MYRYNIVTLLSIYVMVHGSKVLSLTGLSREEFDNELQKGVDSIQASKTHSIEEVDDMLAKEFGI